MFGYEPIAVYVLWETELLGIDILYEPVVAEANIIKLSVMPAIDSGFYWRSREADTVIYLFHVLGP